MGLLANEHGAFDELGSFEPSKRANKGGMTLGSAELAPLFYFTPIAFHFEAILKLTESGVGHRC